MQRSADPLKFAAVFLTLSALLGWTLWRATQAPQVAPLRDAMVVVPAVSAMLAARGFGWHRKLAYAAAALGGYVTAGFVATASGFHTVVAQQLASGGQPSILTTLYLTFLTTFPFVVLVLFVGRTPALLWSTRRD